MTKDRFDIRIFKSEIRSKIMYSVSKVVENKWHNICYMNGNKEMMKKYKSPITSETIYYDKIN